MLRETISAVTTPLTLAALALLLGAGIVRLIAGNRGSGVGKTILQYGFWLAVILSVSANIVFAFQSYLQTESLISGSVRSENGRYLANAIVDIRGIERDITDDNGTFSMSIPRSRTQDGYELDLSLKGYENKTVTVKPGERTVTVALSLKQLVVDEFLSIGANVLIGHYLGFPQVDLEITMSNSTLSEVSVSDILLTVTPSGAPEEEKVFSVSHTYFGDGMPPMPAFEPRRIASNRVQRESYAFMEPLRVDIVQFDQHIKGVIARIGINNLRMDRNIISDSLAYAAQHDMEGRWFWKTADYELVFSCTVDGRRFHATGTVQLSEDKITAMKNISKYYDSGFGLSYGIHYLHVGDAKPSLIAESDFTYSE